MYLPLRIDRELGSSSLVSLAAVSDRKFEAGHG